MLFKRYTKLRSGDILKKSELEETHDRIQFLKEARYALIQKAKTTLRYRGLDCDNIDSLADLMDKINSQSLTVREKRPRFDGNVRDLRDEVQDGEILLMVKAGSPIRFNIKTHKGAKFIVEWKEGNSIQKQVFNDNNSFIRNAPNTGEDSVDKTFKYTVYRIYSPGVIKGFTLPWGGLGKGMCWFVSKGINFEETWFNPSDYMSGDWGYQDLEYIDILDGGTQFIRANGCGKLLEIEADYIYLNERQSAKFMFKDCKKLTKLPRNSIFKCNNFSSAFQNCHALVSLPNIDLSNSEENQNAFENCHSLIRFNNNTIKINKNANCNYMVNGCSSLLEIPNIIYGDEELGAGNSFTNTFSNCTAATKISPSLNLSYCKRGTSSMFYGCAAIIDGPSEILLYNSINDSVRYSVSSMFEKCKALRSITNQITSVNVDNTSKMYYDCISLKKAPKCIFVNVLNCTYMYANCYTLVTPPEVIDFPNVWDATSMFEECRLMQSAPNTINLKNAKTIYKMFYNCTAMATGPNSMDISSSINNTSAFEKCSSLEKFCAEDTTINLHKTSDNSSMFLNCSKLKTVCAFNGGMTYTNTFNGTELEKNPVITSESPVWFESTFRDSKIKSVDFSRINTPNVVTMTNMFLNSAIEGALIVDLSKYEKCYSFHSLFKGTSITSIDITLPNYKTNASEICNACNKLKTVKITIPNEETIVESLMVSNNFITSIEINGNFKRSHSLFNNNPNMTKVLKIGTPKWEFWGEESNYYLNRFTMLESCSISTNLHLKVIINNNKKLKDIDLTLIHENKLTSSAIISLTGNYFSKEVLDKILTNLPDINTFTKEREEYIAEIHIASNPGTATCDTSIATNKGWIVYTS